MWRLTHEDAPPNFIRLLYDEEEELEEKEEKEELEEKVELEEKEELEELEESMDEENSTMEHVWIKQDCEEDLETYERYEPYTTHPGVSHPATPQKNEARDRSPLRAASSSSRDSFISFPLESMQGPHVPMEFDVRIRYYDEHLNEIGGESGDEFLAPDSHALYVPPQDVTARRGGRGARRGGRSVVRGRSPRASGYSRRGRRGPRWEVGHPLNEIWTSDEDVPAELLSLARDVIRRRQTGVREAGRMEGDEASGSEDEHDDSDGADSLPSLEGRDLQFEWSPMESFQGLEEQFRIERTGSVFDFNSAYDAFRSYWDDDIISLIVTEANSYATKIVTRSFQAEWFPTNSHEILCLFAFWMMLAIIKMPTMVSCFSSDPLLETTVFKRIFTRKRYEMLNRALHFVESDPADNDSNPTTTSAARSLDRVHRLRPIIDHLNSKFQSNYVLEKNICIDESLTLWKGRLDIKQYIRSKAARFGIKTFELCESVTGYLWSFIVYTGKQPTADLEQSPRSPGELKSQSVVKKLMSPLLNKGYRLFLNNWCNSPLLARFLKRNGTDCVGTLTPTRKNVPLVISKAPLKRGEYIARHSGDVSVMAWQDKNRVTMISTCHSSSSALPTVPSRASSRPVPFKPQVVLDYNKYMGGVDTKDQMLEPYLLERKRAKWYMKLFKRLINVSILNARILVRSSTRTHQHHLAFRLQLVDSILTNHLSHCPQSRSRTAATNRAAHAVPGRFIVSTHWPAPMTASDGYYATQKSARKMCVACRQKKTTFSCESCHVPLCIHECFKAYHTAP